MWVRGLHRSRGMKRLRNDTLGGTDFVELLIVLVAVAFVAVIGLNLYGNSIREKYGHEADQVAALAGGAGPGGDYGAHDGEYGSPGGEYGSPGGEYGSPGEWDLPQEPYINAREQLWIMLTPPLERYKAMTGSGRRSSKPSPQPTTKPGYLPVSSSTYTSFNQRNNWQQSWPFEVQPGQRVRLSVKTDYNAGYGIEMTVTRDSDGKQWVFTERDGTKLASTPFQALGGRATSYQVQVKPSVTSRRVFERTGSFFQSSDSGTWVVERLEEGRFHLTLKPLD